MGFRKSTGVERVFVLGAMSLMSCNQVVDGEPGSEEPSVATGESALTAPSCFAPSVAPLALRDVTWAQRSIPLTGTEYFSVQSGAWANGREVYLISADGKFTYDYPGRSFDGSLVIGHTFGTSASSPYTVDLTYVDSAGASRSLQVCLPAFSTAGSGRKMVFHVARDGSSYYADPEHDGYNYAPELLTAEQALQPKHLARARLAPTWRPIAAPPAELGGRFGHIAASLPDGMLVWGGEGATGRLYDGARYNLGTDAWQMLPAAPSSIQGRSGFAAVISLKGPALFVWGGTDASKNVKNDGAMLDLSTNKWFAVPPAPITARSGASAGWTENGEIVVWGGDGRNDGAAWNVFTHTWRSLGSAPEGRTGAVATSLDEQTIAFFGGSGPSGTATTGLLLDVEQGTWSSLDPGLEPRSHFAELPAREFGGGPFYFGGTGQLGSGLSDGAVLSPAGTWQTVPSPGSLFLGRYGMGSFNGPAGHCVVGGKGIDVENGDNLGGCYAPGAGWTAFPWMPAARVMRAFPSSVFDGRRVMIWGGHSRTEFLRDGWIYDYGPGCA